MFEVIVMDVRSTYFTFLFQGFLQYGVPATPEKLLALMNKVRLGKLFKLTLDPKQIALIFFQKGRKVTASIYIYIYSCPNGT
jgi:hypothetical protein